MAAETITGLPGVQLFVTEALVDRVDEPTPEITMTVGAPEDEDEVTFAKSAVFIPAGNSPFIQPALLELAGNSAPTAKVVIATLRQKGRDTMRVFFIAPFNARNILTPLIFINSRE